MDAVMPRPVQPEMLLALSPQQAAAALGLHVSHIYTALRERRLVARMYGSKRRILVRDLIAWWESWPEAPLPKLSKRRTATPEEIEQ